MTDRAFVKFDAFGPMGVGLTRRPPYPREGLETEPPVHSSHLYVNDENRGIKIGVWECTPHTSKMQPFPVNEFMILLEGSVTMLEEDGKATTVQAGEAFVVPKGVVCQWNQSEPVRKYFAIYGGHPGQEPRRNERQFTVMKVSSGNAGMPVTQSAGDDADIPFEAGSLIYTDATGAYSLGIWEAVSQRSQPALSRSHRLLRVEAGSLTLSDDSRLMETFKKGDAVLIMPGKAITWRGSDDLRVLSCSIGNGQVATRRDAAETAVP